MARRQRIAASGKFYRGNVLDDHSIVGLRPELNMPRQLLASANYLVFSTLVLSASIVSPRAHAQRDHFVATSSSGASRSAAPVRYHANRFPKRAGEYYRLVWGVDLLNVKAVESGELIRFSFHVLDPEKARLLNDKNVEAYLNSPERHVQLVIPSLEKVGKLRQAGDPESGRSYWMAFSNPHRSIRRGDRVNIVIGQFHADGLAIE